MDHTTETRWILKEKWKPCVSRSHKTTGQSKLKSEASHLGIAMKFLQNLIDNYKTLLVYHFSFTDYSLLFLMLFVEDTLFSKL